MRRKIKSCDIFKFANMEAETLDIQELKLNQKRLWSRLIATIDFNIVGLSTKTSKIGMEGPHRTQFIMWC